MHLHGPWTWAKPMEAVLGCRGDRKGVCAALSERLDLTET